jgi:hypothetical protein
MSEGLNRRRGAPYGNQNARKHGFYSSVLTEAERRNLRQAADVKGISEEIDVLRVKLKSILARDPDNVKLISQAVTSLSRLLRTRYKIGSDADPGDALQRGIENILRDIAIPLGLDISKIPHDKPGCLPRRSPP